MWERIGYPGTGAANRGTREGVWGERVGSGTENEHGR